QLHAFAARVQVLGGGAGAASAATDESDADRVTGRSAQGEALDGKGGQQRAAGGSGAGGAEKTAASKSSVGLGSFRFVHGGALRLKLNRFRCPSPCALCRRPVGRDPAD